MTKDQSIAPKMIIFLTHSPWAARNRPCGSPSFLPLVTSSILMVKDNFVR